MRNLIDLAPFFLAFVEFTATAHAADESQTAPAVPSGPRRTWQATSNDFSTESRSRRVR